MKPLSSPAKNATLAAISPGLTGCPIGISLAAAAQASGEYLLKQLFRPILVYSGSGQNFVSVGRRFVFTDIRDHRGKGKFFDIDLTKQFEVQRVFDNIISDLERRTNGVCGSQSRHYWIFKGP
jgi:hypothetical protein